MRATRSRFEVPNQRFKGIWNHIFSKQGSIWGQNFDLGSRMELVLGNLGVYFLYSSSIDCDSEIASPTLVQNPRSLRGSH